jgi:hypothetical protein
MDTAEISREAETEAAEYQDALTTVRRLEIITEIDFSYAGDLVKHAHANWKRLEERRTEITKPMLASKRKVDDLFKPALTALAEIQSTLKGKIAAYTEAQRAAQIQAMHSSADVFAAGGTPTEAIPEVPTVKGVSVGRSYWVADVVDPDAVPRELCSPDPDKIAKAIWYADTAKTPPRPIPGIAFRLQTDVRIRS